MCEDKEIKASTEVTPKNTPKKKKEVIMSGKGDKPRPYSTSREQYARNWDKAFGKKECVICGSDKDIQDMTMDQIHRTGGMYNGDCCKKCRKVIDNKDMSFCDNKHIPNEETLKSMEKTEKGEGLTEIDNVDKVLKDAVRRASESVYIPKGKDIKEIAKDIKERSSVTLLNDVSLEAQLEKVKNNA